MLKKDIFNLLVIVLYCANVDLTIAYVKVSTVLTYNEFDKT